MGLLDGVLGSAVPGGNLSRPLGIAALALLAYRATQGSGGGGILSDLLGGNTQAGAPVPAADQVHQAVPEGLNGLVQRFQQNGLGDKINSWIGTGTNQPIAPDQVHQALGSETVDELSRQTGVPHQDLLSQLSEALPALIDKLTPNGRLPNQSDMARFTGNKAS